MLTDAPSLLYAITDGEVQLGNERYTLEYW